MTLSPPEKPTKMVDTKHVLVTTDDEQAVAAVVRSADLSGNAEAVALYEDALIRYFGSRHAVACSSGTAAIHMSLLALGVTRDDEVIVPATAPAMTALPILAIGARPVFADVANPSTFALDIEDVKSKVTVRTKVVMSVPMWGYPADGRELVSACQELGVWVVEDAAQAHGTLVDDRYAGTHGVIGTFSTHVRKLVATGEGGFCLTDDHDLAQRLNELRNLGQAVDGAGFGTTFGLNFKLSAVCAALGRTQLGRLNQRIAVRRELVDRLGIALSQIRGVSCFPTPTGGRSNCYAMLITTADETAVALTAYLQEAGILSDVLRYRYEPLYRAPLFQSSISKPCLYAEKMIASLVALPCHEGVTADVEARILDACQRVVA